MRAPSPSFRTELATYCADLAANREHFSDRDYALANEVLDRWEKRDDMEEVWSTIKAKCPHWPPRDFLLDVLASSSRASKLDAIIRDLPDCCLE
jgi:hypothetical protein